MKWIPPYDRPSNSLDRYVDLNAATGTDGSIIPAALPNVVQDEILNVITGAGLTPNAADATQLRQAILSMIPTPTGAPSDASLVHYAVDVSSTANDIAITPSPSVTGLSTGLTVIFRTNGSVTGASTITLTPSAGSPVTKPLLRSTGENTSAGDVVAGRLYAATYDPFIGPSGSWRLFRDDRNPVVPSFGGAQGAGQVSVSVNVPAGRVMLINSTYIGVEDLGYNGWPSDFVVGALKTLVNGTEVGSLPIRCHLNWIDIWSAGRSNVTAHTHDMMFWSAPTTGVYTFTARAQNMSGVAYTRPAIIAVYGV